VIVYLAKMRREARPNGQDIFLKKFEFLRAARWRLTVRQQTADKADGEVAACCQEYDAGGPEIQDQ